MARITVEDCLKKINNKFILVVLAAQRASQLALDSPSLLPKSDDKYPVQALREIAGSLINPEELQEAVIKKYQRVQKKIKDHEDTNEGGELFSKSSSASSILSEEIAQEIQEESEQNQQLESVPEEEFIDEER
jgi:DNA-directed RNA polymerase subunit omega